MKLDGPRPPWFSWIFHIFSLGTRDYRKSVMHRASGAMGKYCTTVVLPQSRPACSDVDDPAPSLSNCCCFDSQLEQYLLRVHNDENSQEPRFTLLSLKSSCYLCFFVLCFNSFKFSDIFSPESFRHNSMRQLHAQTSLRILLSLPLACWYAGGAGGGWRGLLSLTLEYPTCFRKCFRHDNL